MFRSVVLAVFMLGCGGPARPVGPTPPGEPVARGSASVGRAEPRARPAAAARPAATVVTPAEVCDRVLALRDGGCAAFAGYELDRAACVDDVGRSLADRGPDARRAMEQVGRCVLDRDGCDAASACVAALAPDGDGALRACGEAGSDAAVGLPPDAWAARKGAGVRRFSAAASSPGAPIEVCGVDGQLAWLRDASCDDGSRPFRTASEAHAARVRNVGPGGRCGAIIDLYEVRCPEGAYELYLDAYVCPLPAPAAP